MSRATLGFSVMISAFDTKTPPGVIPGTPAATFSLAPHR